MKLDAYLRTAGLTEQAFADQIGTTQASVNRYRNGRVPGPDVLERIAKTTGGQVMPNDFYTLPEQREAS